MTKMEGKKKPTKPQIEVIKSKFVSVDPGSISEMCKEANLTADEVDSQIFKFETPRPHSNEIFGLEFMMLEIKFDRPMTSSMVERISSKEKYSSANIAHLISYLKASADNKDSYPLVALGSSSRGWSGFGNRVVPLRPATGPWAYGKKLSVGWHGNTWHESCRFLVLA